MSVADAVSWRLSRPHREVAFTQLPELDVFSDTRSTCLSRLHAHPAWTLFLPVDGGSVTVADDDGPAMHHQGVLLPPQHDYRAETDGPHVALYLNAWMAPRADGRGRRTLDDRSTRRLLAALHADGDVDRDAVLAQLAPLVGAIRVADGRLASAIEVLPHTPRLDDVARSVGLSTSRLSVLSRRTIGVPLTQLRLWARLWRAVALLPHAPAAVAAAATGFADQPHLTRVARRFFGRTPGDLDMRSLRLPVGSREPGRGAEGTGAGADRGGLVLDRSRARPVP